MLKASGEDAGRDGPTSAARGAATRERILRDAFELIGDVGWSRVTTRLLARRVGVKAALINYHFRSRRACFTRPRPRGSPSLVGPAMERAIDPETDVEAAARVLEQLLGARDRTKREGTR